MGEGREGKAAEISRMVKSVCSFSSKQDLRPVRFVSPCQGFRCGFERPQPSPTKFFTRFRAEHDTMP